MPTPPPAIYQLLGYPGTGKYTVARALVDQLEAGGATVRLIDNHLVANPGPYRSTPAAVIRGSRGVDL